MNNNELITKLSNDLNGPIKSLSRASYIGRFLIFANIAIIIQIIAIPLREEISHHLGETKLITDIILWTLLAISSAYSTFNYLVPGIKKSLFNYTPYLVLSLVILHNIYYLNFNELLHSFANEFQLWRGPCLLFIMGSSFFLYFSLKKVISKGMISDPINFTIMFALSLGSIGTLAMQFICVHPSSEHMFVWHVPTFLIISALSYRKFSKIK